MECQTVLPESLREYRQHSARIALVREDDCEIVRVPDQDGRAFQSWLDLMLKPLVQYLVKIDVRKQR